MSDRESLLAEIRKVLPQGGTSLIEQSALNDLFEAYILSGLVSVARTEAWNVSLCDMHERPAPRALFRRSPGNIYLGSGSQNFTHFLLDKVGVPPLEAHIGIKSTGKSDIEHECDVALLPHDTASSCRLDRVHPKSARLILSAECKFLASGVPLHMGRGFVGLDLELGSQYGECHFVVNTSSRSVMKMLSRRNRKCHERVHPGTGRLETFQSACRLALHNYVMRVRMQP